MRMIKKLLVVAVAGALLVSSALGVSAAGLKDIFDAKYYADSNPDLKAAYGYDEEALYNHFITWGLKEKRQMNPLVDLYAYRDSYADLDKAYGDNWDGYADHFLAFGMKEKRTEGVLFNPLVYAEAYPDIKAAFGDDLKAIISHYQTSGAKEGRKAGTITAVKEEKAAKAAAEKAAAAAAAQAQANAQAAAAQAAVNAKVSVAPLEEKKSGATDAEKKAVTDAYDAIKQAGLTCTNKGNYILVKFPGVAIPNHQNSNSAAGYWRGIGLTEYKDVDKYDFFWDDSADVEAAKTAVVGVTASSVEEAKWTIGSSKTEGGLTKTRVDENGVPTFYFGGPQSGTAESAANKKNAGYLVVRAKAVTADESKGIAAAPAKIVARFVLDFTQVKFADVENKSVVWAPLVDHDNKVDVDADKALKAELEAINKKYQETALSAAPAPEDANVMVINFPTDVIPKHTNGQPREGVWRGIGVSYAELEDNEGTLNVKQSGSYTYIAGYAIDRATAISKLKTGTYNAADQHTSVIQKNTSSGGVEYKASDYATFYFGGAWQTKGTFEDNQWEYVGVKDKDGNIVAMYVIDFTKINLNGIYSNKDNNPGS